MIKKIAEKFRLDRLSALAEADLVTIRLGFHWKNRPRTTANDWRAKSTTRVTVRAKVSGLLRIKVVAG